MKTAQTILKNEGYEKEDFFDQLTYDLAKSYEAEISKDLSLSGHSSKVGSPTPHDFNHIV